MLIIFYEDIIILTSNKFVHILYIYYFIFQFFFQKYEN